MRILNISTVIPYPPTDGGRSGIYYPLKHLAARGHELTVACLAERPDPSAVRHLETFCRVECQPFTKRPVFPDAIWSLASPRPFNLSRYYAPAFQKRVIALARTVSYDVVEVSVSTARIGLAFKEAAGVPVVLRAHNVHWVNIERLIAQWKNPAGRLFVWYETRKTRREELSLYARVDLNLTVSDHDAELLHRYDDSIRCMTVPAGVELGEFSGERAPEEPRSVLWMGTLGWLPNQDSFWWFYKSIVPEIVRRDPRVRITVVGSNPPRNITDLRHPNVEVLGYVEDLRSVLRRSQVCVVPLRAGSGIRIKLLEMFAERRAVVSTTIGCEGLGVENGRQLLVADDPADFASAVLRLLDDRQLRFELGDRGREHVALRYGWERIAAQYEEAYRSVIEAGTGRSRGPSARG